MVVRTLMRRALLMLGFMIGCGAGQSGPAAPGEVAAGRCDAELPSPIERPPARPGLMMLMRPISTIPFEVAIDLGDAKKALEAQVPMRIADEHGRDLGAVGKLTLTIDRSPFRFAIEGGRLVVKTDLTTHAQMCKPLGVFGCVQYASCDPTAVARASVAEALTPAARFSPSAVNIDFAERCVVTAFHIDVTDMIDQAARGETKKVEQRIDRALPDLHAEAERAWRTLAKTMPLRQGACVALHPTTLVQGRSRIEGEKLVVRLGVVASPSVSMPCAVADADSPLPPLRFDPALPDTFSLHVPVALTADALTSEWRGRLLGKTVSAGDDALRVTSVSVAIANGNVALDVGVGGSACGIVSFDVAPSWDAQRQLVTFAATPIAGELERLRGVARKADAVALGRAIAEKLDMTLPASDASLGTALDGLKVPLAQGGPELAVAVTEHAPEAIAVTNDAIEARFVLRGKARIDLPSLDVPHVDHH